MHVKPCNCTHACQIHNRENLRVTRRSSSKATANQREISFAAYYRQEENELTNIDR